MKMTKITKVTWQNPQDPKKFQQRNFESSLFTVQMELQGKTKSCLVRRVSVNDINSCLERLWRDQAAAEEYIQHLLYLADKYHGKILDYEIKDLDQAVKIDYNIYY